MGIFETVSKVHEKQTYIVPFVLKVRIVNFFKYQRSNVLCVGPPLPKSSLSHR